MAGNVVTRFPGGLTNVAESNMWADYIDCSPSKVHAYFNDFDTYQTGDWTVTETSSGATQAITDGDGGLLLLTGVASSGTIVALNKVGSSFTFESASGKSLFFESRFKVSEATLSGLVMGLQVTDNTPFAVTDGVFFTKASGSTNLLFVVQSASTATSTVATTVADDTYLQVGYSYDGGTRLAYSVAGVEVGVLPITNMPAAASNQTISMAVASGSSGAQTMTIDYVNVVKTR